MKHKLSRLARTALIISLCAVFCTPIYATAGVREQTPEFSDYDQAHLYNLPVEGDLGDASQYILLTEFGCIVGVYSNYSNWTSLGYVTTDKEILSQIDSAVMHDESIELTADKPFYKKAYFVDTSDEPGKVCCDQMDIQKTTFVAHNMNLETRECTFETINLSVCENCSGVWINEIVPGDHLHPRIDS